MPFALHTITTIARREAVAALTGVGVYLATSMAAAAATWLLLVEVRAVQTAGVLVPADPFRTPLDAALLVLALYFAVHVAVSTARDRESGTLEVLFYGPVDELTYVCGKTLGLLAAYIVALPLLALSLFLLSALSGFAISARLGLGLVASVVPAAMVVSFGLLLAVGTSRVRSAILLLGAATLVLLGGTTAYSIVLMVPIDNPSSPVLALRDALENLNSVLRWISPFSYLERIVAEGVAIGGWRAATAGIGGALIATAAMTSFAALLLRHRGVQRVGE